MRNASDAVVQQQRVKRCRFKNQPPSRQSSNKIAREYVLPDGVSILRGYVKARGLGRGALRDVSLEANLYPSFLSAGGT